MGMLSFDGLLGFFAVMGRGIASVFSGSRLNPDGASTRSGSRLNPDG
jgi:hypothetical protein